MAKRRASNPFSTINPNAAGIDIGATHHVVAVAPDRDPTPVRTFSGDLHALADWLQAVGITTVAMESTGVYWIPVFEILEARGFEVVLVNARDVKQVPGRKTDVNDAQWLQQLHQYGLLRGSFRPREAVVQLRAYLRLRERLIEYAAAHIQHMQKALLQMNLQLHHAVTDITGVTGMRILRAIVLGERSPEVLAAHRDVRCAASDATLRAALTGHYRPEHVFALQQALELYDFHRDKIAECDTQIETALRALAAERTAPTTPLPAQRHAKGRNEPAFEVRTVLHRLLGADLSQIHGLGRCLRVTPSGFYAWLRRPESTRAREDRRLKILVRASFDGSRRNYGSPRVHEDLIEQHVRVSRKRVVRLMQEEGLKARVRKRYKHTTVSDHDQPIADNLLKQTFTAGQPNQRWVGDTTEFVIGTSGKLYLAAILDLFSRFVVGWAVSAVNDRHLTIKALEMALKRRCPKAGLWHHSDQGSTYASEDYQAILDANGVVCSMSRRGNCYDNAVMESFFSTVKSELGDQFASNGDAKMELFDYIEVFYNQRRRHSTLGQISPAAFERRATQAA